MDECYLECPIQCSSVDYTLIPTQAHYPSEWYAANLANDSQVRRILLNSMPKSERADAKIDTSLVRSSFLMLNVYYDEMFYTLIDDAPALTMDQLIALIGGNLGLFLGISLMSLVESFELLFYSIFLSFKLNRPKN
jgi:hypothetical protein